MSTTDANHHTDPTFDEYGRTPDEVRFILDQPGGYTFDLFEDDERVVRNLHGSGGWLRELPGEATRGLAGVGLPVPADGARPTPPTTGQPAALYSVAVAPADLTDAERLEAAGHFYLFAQCFPVLSSAARDLMAEGDRWAGIVVARPEPAPAPSWLERTWQRLAVAVASRTEPIEDPGLEGPALG